MRRAVILGSVATLCGVPYLTADAGSFEVPAISNPATGVHEVGKLIWLDLETTDLPGAKRFYRALFGWDYRDYHSYGLDYTVAVASGSPVAGLVRRRIVKDTERPSAWLPFFSVADVSVTFQQALAAHAKIRSDPENLPLRGRQARLRDPEGATFALVSSSSGDPPDDPHARALGTWGVPSLLARDPAGEAVFYQTLFYYAVVGDPTAHGFERIQLETATEERASVRPLPDGSDPLNPQWIAFARVASTADTVRKAQKLGGHILVATMQTQDGIEAILEDPTGAAFGIAELPETVVSQQSR
jgi:predicted enzyme related to lactoylglutathione lyase